MYCMTLFLLVQLPPSPTSIMNGTALLAVDLPQSGDQSNLVSSIQYNDMHG